MLIKSKLAVQFVKSTISRNMLTVAVVGTARPGAKNICGPLFENFYYRNYSSNCLSNCQSSNASKLFSVASDESFFNFLYINELCTGKRHVFYKQKEVCLLRKYVLEMF